MRKGKSKDNIVGGGSQQIDQGAPNLPKWDQRQPSSQMPGGYSARKGARQIRDEYKKKRVQDAFSKGCETPEDVRDRYRCLQEHPGMSCRFSRPMVLPELGGEEEKALEEEKRDIIDE